MSVESVYVLDNLHDRISGPVLPLDLSTHTYYVTRRKQEQLDIYFQVFIDI